MPKVFGRLCSDYEVILVLYLQRVDVRIVVKFPERKISGTRIAGLGGDLPLQLDWSTDYH